MSAIHIPESFQNRPYAAERFEAIVKWASEEHPFYQRWLPDPSQEIPLLTRETILENNDLLLNGRPERGQTSGSMGVPVRFAWSAQKIRANLLSNRIMVQWLGGRVPTTRIVRLKTDHKPADLMDVMTPLEDQLEFIRSRFHSHRAIALATYPTNATNLSRAIVERGLDFSFIKRIMCFAESLEAHQEGIIQQAFPQARIWTNYSTSEMGMIACRCPHDPDHHHIMANAMGVEILSEDGSPCDDGEAGRVVLTDYFNRDMPFIRYDIGDMAARGSCGCTQIGLPALRTIFGRVRGALKNLQGQSINLTGSSLGPALAKVEGLRQYQVIQEELNLFTFRYVSSPGVPDAGLREGVTDALARLLGHRPCVVFKKQASIEHEPSGKFFASICRV